MYQCMNVCMYGYFNEHNHIYILLYKFINPFMYSCYHIVMYIYAQQRIHISIFAYIIQQIHFIQIDL